MEPMDIVGKAKEDASLPKATMTKIIKEMLPPDVRVARDAQDLLIECCVEFINLISSESNEVCGREERRTIAPEHVLKALEVLGFGEYIEEVYAAYEQHRLETVDSVRVGKCSNRAEMTEEEAAAEQQRMFAEARARMNGGVVPKQPEMSPEEVAAEQQRLFAEARARMNGGGSAGGGAGGGSGVTVTVTKQADPPMCSNNGTTEVRRIEEPMSEQQRFFAEAFARMNGVSIPFKQPETIQVNGGGGGVGMVVVPKQTEQISGGGDVGNKIAVETEQTGTEMTEAIIDTGNGGVTEIKEAKVNTESGLSESEKEKEKEKV